MTITHIQTQHVEAYAAACAQRAGVSVKWGDPGTIPATNGKVLVIPKMTSKMTDEGLNRLRYHIKHEVQHLTYTDFDYFNSQGNKGLLQFIANAVEDNRNEYLNDSEYLGDKAISNAYMSHMSQRIKERLKSGGEMADDVKHVLPLVAWDMANRHWLPNAALAAHELEALMDADQLEKYKKLQEFDKKLAHVRSFENKREAAEAVQQLSEELLRTIWEQNPEDYKQPKEEKSSSGSSGDEGDKEGEGAGASEKEGDGKDGKPVSDGKDRLIKVKKLLESDGAHCESRTGIHSDYDDSAGGYTIPTPGEYKVGRWPLTAEFKRSMGITSRVGRYFDAAGVSSFIDSESKPLSAKLRHKLQIRAQSRYEGNKKHGSVHSGSLHKLITAKGTRAAERVFRKKIVSDTLDTVVTLLVDCSGSMSGHKFETACSAAAALSQALRPLHITHNVLGFTNDHSGKDNPVVWVFSDWGEHLTQKELVDRFGVASAVLYENTDGDGIAWAAAHLYPRKEHRKLLIVLSDGSPAGRRWAGSCAAYTRDVINKIQEQKVVEIYGIGICDHNVERYYKNHVVIKTPNELANSVLTIIDKAV